MTQKSYFVYDNIDLDDCLETMGLTNKCIRNRMHFSLALSDLLRSYDELACATHSGLLVREALIHLYSRLHTLSSELTVNGIKSSFNIVLTEEIAMMFCMASGWALGDVVKFAAIDEIDQRVTDALTDLLKEI